MFTLEQFKAVILENEKLQKEINELKEALKKANSDNTWKTRALTAESALESLSRKADSNSFSDEDKWLKLQELVDNDSSLNVIIQAHVELFNLGLRTAKKEVIERFFRLDQEGNYVKA